MVKRRRRPTRSGMAGITFGAKAAIMNILGSMAGITIGRSACIDAIGMATGTGYVEMFAGQLVDRQVMVKRGRRPARCGMAGITFGAKPAIMDVLGSMAAIAG